MSHRLLQLGVGDTPRSPSRMAPLQRRQAELLHVQQQEGRVDLRCGRSPRVANSGGGTVGGRQGVKRVLWTGDDFGNLHRHYPPSARRGMGL
jgi:hypothetical protein